MNQYRTSTPDLEAPVVPFFSFEDAGIRSAISRFADGWGDAQAQMGWHDGLIVDASDLDAQAALECRALLARGDARTDDASAFERAFVPAWADAYAARIVAAEKRGY